MTRHFNVPCRPSKQRLYSNFKVLEWHKKLEDLRLQELRWRRQSERLQREVQHLTELSNNQAKRIDLLEEECVRLESIMEQRQIDWEIREVELENIQLQQNQQQVPILSTRLYL